MNSKNLGVIFGPTLIRPRPTTAPVTISSLAEYSNQARLVEFLITYSQKIFDGSLQPQAVVISNTGAVAPQVDQGYLPKPLLSPDERDTDHSMKPLFFSSKEVSCLLLICMCICVCACMHTNDKTGLYLPWHLGRSHWTTLGSWFSPPPCWVRVCLVSATVQCGPG